MITCSTTFKIWMFLLIKHNDYVSGFEPRLLVAFPAKSDFLSISHACYPKEINLLRLVKKWQKLPFKAQSIEQRELQLNFHNRFAVLDPFDRLGSSGKFLQFLIVTPNFEDVFFLNFSFEKNIKNKNFLMQSRTVTLTQGIPSAVFGTKRNCSNWKLI